MYRTFALFLACGAAAAPQDAVTYVKIQQTDPNPPYGAPVEDIPLPTEIADILETSTTDGSSQNIFTVKDIPLPTAEIRDILESSTRSRAESTTEQNTYFTETTEAATERDKPRTPHEPRTKPRFYSKLSYFEKPEFSAVLTNLVERPARRRFRSRCRCEKISNCPKLQISVPRCPNEQFMCCF